MKEIDPYNCENGVLLFIPRYQFISIKPRPSSRCRSQGKKSDPQPFLLGGVTVPPSKEMSQSKRRVMTFQCRVKSRVTSSHTPPGLFPSFSNCCADDAPVACWKRRVFKRLLFLISSYLPRVFHPAPSIERHRRHHMRVIRCV